LAAAVTQNNMQLIGSTVNILECKARGCLWQAVGLWVSPPRKAIFFDLPGCDQTFQGSVDTVRKAIFDILRSAGTRQISSSKIASSSIIFASKPLVHLKAQIAQSERSSPPAKSKGAKVALPRQLDRGGLSGGLRLEATAGNLNVGVSGSLASCILLGCGGRIQRDIIADDSA
jgi:hypothetical protein